MTIKPDITVASDPTGDFTTIQAAIDAIPQNNSSRKVIFIKRGTYPARIKITRNFITLLGEERHNTRIEYAIRAEDFQKAPDAIGRAVVNIEASDVTLQNLTVENTQPQTGPHAFAIHGEKLSRLIVRDCDILSLGADTFAPWNKEGMSFVKNCLIKGGVDFLCPRGWCFMEDCSLFEVIRHAALWHDGRKDHDMKFVIRNCKFDGVKDFFLGRRHHDAQFYLLDCTFSDNMSDEYIFRQTYPYEPLQNAVNLWGDRAWYHNCHRPAGDYPWHKNNLRSAPGSPKPEDITPAWTFGGRWDPEI
jgi:pectinesterase